MKMMTSWIKSLLSILTGVLLLLVAGGPQANVSLALTPTQVWSGHIVSVTEDLSLRGSVLRVSVVGLKGLPVKVSTLDGGWSVTGFTGSKSEFGEYMVEFAALGRGEYIIEPQGLGTSLLFQSDAKSYVVVEFSKGPAATGTPTSQPLPSATWTSTWTSTPQLTQTPTLTPFPPTVTPELIIVVPENSPTPATPMTATPFQSVRTAWSGHIAFTMKGFPPSPGTIAVRVIGRENTLVELTNGGFRAYSTVGSKPEYGTFACEFGGLGPGVYNVRPQGIDSSVTVDLGQGEFAMVEFTPVTVVESPTQVVSTPVMTGGVVVSTAIAQPTATMTNDWSKTVMTATLPVQAGASFSMSDSLAPPFKVGYPLTKPAWVAQVTQRVHGTGNGPATVVVRVLGARNLPVILKSDGWQTSVPTGTKPEYGDFACEFGGLPAGKYEIIPDGMGLTHEVEVEPSEFVLVEFMFKSPPRPDTIPALVFSPNQLAGDVEGSWSGRVISRTLGTETTGNWGSIVVEVLGIENLPVEVRSVDGWSSFTLTESREGYQGFVSEFVRLSPGVYQVVPQGLGTWVELSVEEDSRTWIEFASQ